MGRPALVVAFSAAVLAWLAGTARPAPTATPLATAVEALPVALEVGPAYVATAFGGRYDADGNGCDTRAEVLLAEAVVAPRVGAGCSLAGGRWRSPYDGVNVAAASALEVEPTVPLEEAWRSGAAGWDAARRAAFANDLGFAGSLTGVFRGVARGRGGADPARWLPPLTAARCAYAADWVAVKRRWSLSVDAAERQALLRLAKRCGSTPVPAPPGVPLRPASAITGPPASLAGVNLQQARYGTGADPAMITLGPKTGGSAGGTAYQGKTSMEFELPDGTPVLAPLDMRLVGFDNRSAVRRTKPDGQVQSPFDDLELCFQSAAPDWPGLLTCVYHVRSSPLLLGQGLTGACSVVPEWIGTDQAAGHLFYERDDYVRPASARSDACGALLGRLVRRGGVIAYAGAVGQHTFASFRFKVPAAATNPLVRKGDPHLHWVQPGSFFYWACFGRATVFSPGVLAYPFECEGYRLPAAQRDPGFKLR